MYKSFTWCGLSGSIIFMLASASVAYGEEADGFGWSIRPYLWATETSVDLTFRDANIGAGELSFGYQVKTAEFRDDDLRLDFDYQGPMAGFNFRF